MDVDMVLNSRLYQDLRSKPDFVRLLTSGAKVKTAFVV